tara:strand:+ start:25 stop:375 length:351 start_codon:yes stop_codon:yes gene_type:complete
MEFNYKKKNDFEKRCRESENVLSKYPDRIPIIVERSKKCTFDDIDKSKYLVPKDMTMGQFTYIIRKRIKLDPSQTIFISVNGSLSSSTEILSSVYDDKKDEDGFLYVNYTNENTFG